MRDGATGKPLLQPGAFPVENRIGNQEYQMSNVEGKRELQNAEQGILNVEVDVDRSKLN